MRRGGSGPGESRTALNGLRDVGLSLQSLEDRMVARLDEISAAVAMLAVECAKMGTRESRDLQVREQHPRETMEVASKSHANRKSWSPQGLQQSDWGVSSEGDMTPDDRESASTWRPKTASVEEIVSRHRKTELSPRSSREVATAMSAGNFGGRNVYTDMMESWERRQPARAKAAVAMPKLSQPALPKRSKMELTSYAEAASQTDTPLRGDTHLRAESCAIEQSQRPKKAGVEGADCRECRPDLSPRMEVGTSHAMASTAASIDREDGKHAKGISTSGQRNEALASQEMEAAEGTDHDDPESGIDSRLLVIEKALERIGGAVGVRGGVGAGDDEEDRKRLKEKLKDALDREKKLRLRTIVSVKEVRLSRGGLFPNLFT
jgi:hypothetical protein